MLAFLKNHPFAVDAFFECSLVLTYAVPQTELRGMIPPCLTLDTFADEWGFVAVALVQTKDLRPTGLPRFLGKDFFLIGYRIFVRYTTRAGKRLRGLYILKSETDNKIMTGLGSLFSKYRYTTTDIRQTTNGTIKTITSQQSGLHIAIDTDVEPEATLPPGSPFSTQKEARRFAGPLPFTFSYNPETKAVLMVKGMRENWEPTPVQVLRADVSFLENIGLKNSQLANAFTIENIPYHWERGRMELWNG